LNDASEGDNDDRPPGPLHGESDRSTSGVEPDAGEAPPMQRINKSSPKSDRSAGPLRCKRPPTAGSSARTIDAAGILTLAPAFAQALPTPANVPTAYSHEFRAELLYDLCSALVRESLGGLETWPKCEDSAVVFAQRAILESIGIGEERLKLLERNVEYHLSVSDVAERDRAEAPLGEGSLAITIECGGSGFLKIGPAIEALEEEADGLGAAFYWTLSGRRVDGSSVYKSAVRTSRTSFAKPWALRKNSSTRSWRNFGSIKVRSWTLLKM
jgi:hypothetical protein